jgi:hypothetical protein
MKLTLTRIVEVNGRGEYQKSFILEKIWCDWFVHLIESYLIIICMSPIHNVVETCRSPFSCVPVFLVLSRCQENAHSRQIRALGRMKGDVIT